VSRSPKQFDGVSVVTKANVYFEGKVVSHTVCFPDGTRKSLGIVRPGAFTFNTGVPEVMEITAGRALVRLAGQPEWKEFPAGTSFAVPGNSSFEIKVEEGIAEYICSFGV